MEKALYHHHFCVTKQGGFRLKDHPTDMPLELDKKELKEAIAKDNERIVKLQERLYAEGTRSLLLIFQAMDAAGKDSCIRHVLSGVDPTGTQVWSFKAPSLEERAHDFLWRHARSLPERGRIGIHNRSHYEEVLVVKVHPEFVLAQDLPGITAVEHITPQFWHLRYAAIRNFEAHLANQGTVIMKFLLHMAKDVQKGRFLERIEDPEKNWKFSMNDVNERGYWDRYMQAYEEAIDATAAPHAPWYVVPSDEQWEGRAIVARLVREKLEELDPRIPRPAMGKEDELKEALRILKME
ncbi:MAG: polyphosphate kinase 2 family protein [Flavobacteriales bacterium]|nr:polyphosphate kinase 2 family protein [Flavobacteriales bacterium]MCB9193446.1 polyphosphate kinase 2 family protein [Flavobacteriales bacterium]